MKARIKRFTTETRRLREGNYNVAFISSTGIPSFIRITSGKVHDVNILDDITPEPGAFYVMDRAYGSPSRPMFWLLLSRSD